MSNILFKTLSESPVFPFNSAMEDFFADFDIFSDVECYQLFFCPFGEGTSFEDLYKIKFKSKLVILNIMDSIMNRDDHLAIDQLSQFCQDHPENEFIIFNFAFNLQKTVSVENLYVDTIMSAKFTEKYIRCKKENLSNNWVLLNSQPRPHRDIITCYLLSKEYRKNGLISDSYLNNRRLDMSTIPNLFQSDILLGYDNFKSGTCTKASIPPYTGNIFTNYHLILISIYAHTSLEIVTGSLFFEPVPFIGEKEIQVIYAQNFPIFINGPGVVKELSNFFTLDLFNDIIDHSYDTIQDPFARITHAVDTNEHLLNGSTNLKELWFDNKARFTENCNKMDDMLYKKSYQKRANELKILKALDYFDVAYKRKLLRQ